MCVPPVEDSQYVGQTIMGREYHTQIPSGLGETPSGVKGWVSQNTQMKKPMGGGPVKLTVAGADPHQLKTIKMLGRKSCTESITHRIQAVLT